MDSRPPLLGNGEGCWKHIDPEVGKSIRASGMATKRMAARGRKWPCRAACAPSSPAQDLCVLAHWREAAGRGGDPALVAAFGQARSRVAAARGLARPWPGATPGDGQSPGTPVGGGQWLSSVEPMAGCANGAAGHRVLLFTCLYHVVHVHVALTNYS